MQNVQITMVLGILHTCRKKMMQKKVYLQTIWKRNDLPSGETVQYWAYQKKEGAA